MNTFGRIFRVSLFGESHGPAVGVVIDGVEPGLSLSEKDFLEDPDFDTATVFDQAFHLYKEMQLEAAEPLQRVDHLVQIWE